MLIWKGKDGGKGHWLHHTWVHTHAFPLSLSNPQSISHSCTLCHPAIMKSSPTLSSGEAIHYAVHTSKNEKSIRQKADAVFPQCPLSCFGLWRRCSEERRAHRWRRSVRTAHAQIIFLSLFFNHLCRDLVANSGVPQVSGEGWRDGERERKQDLTAQAWYCISSPAHFKYTSHQHLQLNPAAQ